MIFYKECHRYLQLLYPEFMENLTEGENKFEIIRGGDR